MGGISGEADRSEEVDILAVCLNSYRVGVTKMAVSREPMVQLTPNLDTIYPRVCPTIWWHCFHGNGIIGCIWVTLSTSIQCSLKHESFANHCQHDVLCSVVNEDTFRLT